MFHVKHLEEEKTMATLYSNLRYEVTYLAPVAVGLKTDALVAGEERLLAESAIKWFLDTEQWTDKDRQSLRKQFERYGWSIFVWKYYRAARCYLGHYKALSAHLMLKRVP